MAYLNESEVVGRHVELRRTNAAHYGSGRAKSAAGAAGGDPVPSFAETMQASLRKVNTLQTDADQISARAVERPGEVEVHDVMIAAEKARLSLSFTKAVVDHLVRGFKELTMGR